MNAADRQLCLVFSQLLAACGCRASAPFLPSPDDSISGDRFERLLEMAQRNRVTTQLSQWIGGAKVKTVDDVTIRRLHAHCKFDALRRLGLRVEMVRLLAGLREVGINVMALKGPLWADRYHRHPGLREFGDLDLLVRPEDRDRSWQRLLELGYHSPYQNHTLNERYHVVFHHRQTGELIELHWRIASPRFGAFHSAEFLWDGARERQYLSKTLSWEPTVEAALLYLAIHAYKHHWERLQWVLDMPELLRQPSFDWERLDALARRWGAHRLLRANLQLCWFLIPDCPRPAPDHPLSRPVMVPFQLKRICRIMLRPAKDRERLVDFLSLLVANAETSSDRLRLIANRMRVSDRDLDVVGRRSWLHPVAILLRPVRLLGRVIGGHSRDAERNRVKPPQPPQSGIDR